MKKMGMVLLSLLLLVMLWKFDFTGFFISIRQVPPIAFIALLIFANHKPAAGELPMV